MNFIAPENNDLFDFDWDFDLDFNWIDIIVTY